MKIIKLGASWCMPCKMLSATMQKIISQDKYKNIEYVEYDVENDQEGKDLAASEKVMGVPTTIFYDDEGVQFFKMVGNAPQSDIEQIINTKPSANKNKKEEK